MLSLQKNISLHIGESLTCGLCFLIARDEINEFLQFCFQLFQMLPVWWLNTSVSNTQNIIFFTICKANSYYLEGVPFAKTSYSINTAWHTLTRQEYRMYQMNSFCASFPQTFILKTSGMSPAHPILKNHYQTWYHRTPYSI